MKSIKSVRPLSQVTAAASLVLAAGCNSAAQSVDHAPPSEPPGMHALVSAVSADRIYADIETMVGFGTRHTASETESDTRGVGAARRWVHAEFEAISEACGGCLEVIYVGETISGERRIPDPVDVISVLAIQRGSIDPDRTILIGGHLDSRVTDVMNSTSESPGANDDASGVAGAIEAARVLSQREFAGTIVYAAFTGEEQGLIGARIVANYAKEQDWNLVGVFNNDMISNIAGINGVINNSTVRVFSEPIKQTLSEEDRRRIRFFGGEVDSPARNLARYVKMMGDRFVPNLDINLVYRLDRFGRGGDQTPFANVGFPAIRIMETNEHYDRQHQDLRTEDGRVYGDTIDGVDADYAAKLTALNVVSMAGMAGAPPIPEGVSIEGAVSPDTKLSWTRPTGERASNLMGYKVHWRETTSPEWQWSRWVGDVSEFTLENIVIDNYYFGVSAVAKDGSETPVVFPGPAGAFSD